MGSIVAQLESLLYQALDHWHQPTVIEYVVLVIRRTDGDNLDKSIYHPHETCTHILSTDVCSYYIFTTKTGTYWWDIKNVFSKTSL